MKYSITLQNLPFEADSKQVIYVESKYDERINTIIRDNYDRIKKIFKEAKLDFIYLPMLFKDEELKNKVLYFVPYLKPEYMDNIKLHSNHLLQYRKLTKNKISPTLIPPSLIYDPIPVGYDWIFQCKEIILEDDKTDTIVSWIKKAIEGIEFLQNDYTYNAYKCDSEQLTMVGEPQDEEIAKQHIVWDRLKTGILKFGKSIIIEEEDENNDRPRTKESETDETLDWETERTVAEYESIAKQLLSFGLSPSELHDIINNLETISKIRITEDLRIILPDYNNLEVRMSALYKAVYFLFLNNPEGIILQRLEDYHHELMNYYCQTSNRKEPTPQMIDTINRIEYPGNNSIHIVLSRIKAAFYKTFDKHLAERYIVKGTPSELYKIQLDKELIEWEDEYE